MCICVCMSVVVCTCTLNIFILMIILCAGADAAEPAPLCLAHHAGQADVRTRVGTAVTFGRGDLSVCHLGVLLYGPMSILFLIGGVSPRGPPRDKH